MKRLFQITLIVVILLLIVIHQAISANAKQVGTPQEHTRPQTIDGKAVDVKEVIGKRTRLTNYC